MALGSLGDWLGDFGADRPDGWCSGGSDGRWVKGIFFKRHRRESENGPRLERWVSRVISQGGKTG